MTRLRLRQILWIGAGAALVVAALVALSALLLGHFSDTDARTLITLAALLVAGGAALAGLALVDRGTAPSLGWLVAGGAPVGFAFMLWAIWGFVDEGDNEPQAKLAWSAVLALLAALIATTGLLLAVRPALVRLAAAAGCLAAGAASLSIAGIWSGSTSDLLVKSLAALWILAGLSYLLVPVAQRFSATGTEEATLRVLAELNGVEVVASRSPVEGVPIERASPGERLVLRRRG